MRLADERVDQKMERQVKSVELGRIFTMNFGNFRNSQ